MKIKSRPYRLINQIQHYAWGARGAAAFIPRLLNIPVEPGRPYAELWIGAHPKAPSEVVVEGERVHLDRLIAAHPREILGATVAAAFGGRLPFLFKVLSAAEALSIQVHPNKAQAIALHARDPAHYPDANHKPEIAIALDSLTLLAGFKPFAELVATLDAAPALAEFTGAAAARMRAAQHPTPAEAAELVGELYAALLRRSLTEPGALAAAVSRHARQLREAGRPLCEIEERFLALREKYGDDDVGLFSLFLLNLVHLQRGEAIFTPAGVPHAYLEGNLIECMANSDNVVRAGLTPKFRDVETLIEILAPAPGRPAILRPSPDEREIVYRTPASEFEVHRQEMDVGDTRVIRTGGQVEVYLITQGSIQLRWGANGETAIFGQGESFLAPAVMGTFEIAAQEHTEIFRVAAPKESNVRRQTSGIKCQTSSLGSETFSSRESRSAR